MCGQCFRGARGHVMMTFSASAGPSPDEGPKVPRLPRPFYVCDLPETSPNESFEGKCGRRANRSQTPNDFNRSATDDDILSIDLKDDQEEPAEDFGGKSEPGFDADTPCEDTEDDDQQWGEPRYILIADIRGSHRTKNCDGNTGESPMAGMKGLTANIRTKDTEDDNQQLSEPRHRYIADTRGSHRMEICEDNAEESQKAETRNKNLECYG